jgi:tetratricopeptide (TPR) repeat protein
MKTAWVKYLLLITGVILFAGCKNHQGNAVATDDNPIFQSDPALKSITNQINNSPNNAALYFERGNALHKMQLDTLAIKDYKMAAKLDSTKAEYFSAVGDLLFEHKDISGSAEWISKAIALDPKDRKAHLKVAKLFLYTQDFPKAIEELDKVLRQDVYNPEAYFLKGMVYERKKDTARAISNFLTSVQVSPDYRASIVQLGLLYSYKKDPIGVRYLENAYKLDSSDVFPVYAEGVYYQTAGDYEKAKEEYRRCISKNAKYDDAFFNMGAVLMQQDSLEKAFRQFDIVTKIDPANSTAYYDRGVCYEQMNKVSDAINDYKQAYLMDTTYKSPKEALKRLHAKL